MKCCVHGVMMQEGKPLECCSENGGEDDQGPTMLRLFSRVVTRQCSERKHKLFLSVLGKIHAIPSIYSVQILTLFVHLQYFAWLHIINSIQQNCISQR